MIIVYIAGRFTAPTPEGIRANIREAALWGHRVRQLGVGVLVPHLLGAPYVATALDPLEDEFGYDWWIEETLEHMYRCNAVFMVPGWEASSGARGEHEKAIKRGQPVFLKLEEVTEWLSRRAAE